MTELALASPELRMLFDEVDLHPMPQAEAVRCALEYWERSRGDREMPTVAEVNPGDLPRFASYLFAFDMVGDGAFRRYKLVYLGKTVADLTGEMAPGALLSDMEEPAFAHRLQELIKLALTRGEPVGGSFHAEFVHAGKLGVEMFVAPLADDKGVHRRAFGAAAFRHPEHGWENEPDEPD